MTEDEMVEWHNQLYEHEFEQAPGFGDGPQSPPLVFLFLLLEGSMA